MKFQGALVGGIHAMDMVHSKIYSWAASFDYKEVVLENVTQANIKR